MSITPSKNPTKIISDKIKEWVVNNVETTTPAVIVGVVDANRRIVNVQPLLMELEEDGDVIVPPVIFNCPVITQGNVNGYASFPMEVGDTVAISYCKRSIEEVTFGNTTDPVIPEDRRLFGASDAVVLGYWAQNKDHKVSTTDYETRFKDCYIRITPNNAISLETPTCTLVFNSDGTGNITTTNPMTINGSVVNPDGSVNFASGAQATSSGDFVTAGGVSLQALHDAYILHGTGIGAPAPHHPPPAP